MATVQCCINFQFHSGEKEVQSKCKEPFTENLTELFTIARKTDSNKKTD